jgi:hypothetical protein
LIERRDELVRALQSLAPVMRTHPIRFGDLAQIAA